MHTEALLQELDHRGVIEHLGVDEPSLAPGRDREERHPSAEADRTVGGRGGDELVREVNCRGSIRGRLRRRRRHLVIEAAVVLIVVDDEDGLAPHLWVGYEDVENLGDVPGAVVRWPVGVLGVARGRHDIGHLRQLPAVHVAAEVVEQMLGPRLPILLSCTCARNEIDDLGARAAVVEQRRPGGGRRILIHIQHRIVGEVAREGIGGAVSQVGGEGRAGEVLIDLPAHAGGLQHFWE